MGPVLCYLKLSFSYFACKREISPWGAEAEAGSAPASCAAPGEWLPRTGAACHRASPSSGNAAFFEEKNRGLYLSVHLMNVCGAVMCASFWVMPTGICRVAVDRAAPQ